MRLKAECVDAGQLAVLRTTRLACFCTWLAQSRNCPAGRPEESYPKRAEVLINNICHDFDNVLLAMENEAGFDFQELAQVAATQPGGAVLPRWLPFVCNAK